ncbi:MAG: TetR/AcrR family transcriptional regulator [Solirubrobacterales bacterium]|nr:TetR/AcrR family transcriptional regulator [Solirubrobacterales bacterium]
MDLRVEKGRTTRERIVGVARDLFGRQGYDATSIPQVLEAAGVARGALYHHFAGKEALFDAVVDQQVAEIAAVAAEAARAQDDPVDSLRAGFGAWLELAADPAVQRIALLDPPSVLGWERWRELDERHTLGGIKASLRRSGRVAEADADLLAHMLLAAVNEAALMIARAEDPAAALAAGRAAVDALLARVLAPV